MQDPQFENLIEVPVRSLEPGMYVAQLDIPWLESPFGIQGFYIRSRGDVDMVAENCSYVYVDPRRARREPHGRLMGREAVKYEDSVGMREEFDAVQVDYESASQAIGEVLGRVKRGGGVDVAALAQAIGPMIDSILRNKDALAALVRMKRKDDYVYSHCLATAVWSALLGRHIGLDKELLKSLALGAALIDVGKIRMPDKILSKPGRLTPAELKLVRRHVTYGVKLIENDEGVDAAVLATVKWHHERHDGSGYPDGLSGGAIPLMARIAGLTDSYDAMITPRPYAAARSSFDAMQELHDLKGVMFQGELVEQFMQTVGLFPTGSIVELNTGEVAIVVAQNPMRRLKPKVVKVLDAEKRASQAYLMVDLMSEDGENGDALWITKELEAGAFGLDAEEFFL